MRKQHPPNIRAIEATSLSNVWALDALYIQALEAGIIHESEDSAERWVAAAVFAKRDGREAARAFQSIVYQGKWNDIPDYSRRVGRGIVEKCRYKCPLFFRLNSF